MCVFNKNYKAHSWSNLTHSYQISSKYVVYKPSYKLFCTPTLHFTTKMLPIYLFYIFFILLALKLAVWLRSQTITNEVAVRNVYLQLQCMTATFGETLVLPYGWKLEAARSKCSAALLSVDRYLSALDSDYCI